MIILLLDGLGNVSKKGIAPCLFGGSMVNFILDQLNLDNLEESHEFPS